MPDRERRLNRLQRIVDTQTAIVQSQFDLPGLMQMIVETVEELTEAQGAVIELVEGDYMRYRCASGLVASHVGLQLRSDGSLSGLCVKERQTLCCDDSENDPRVDREACRRVGIRSMICTPLFQDGVPIGVLKVVSAQIAAFDDEDVQTLNLLAGLLGAALGKQLAFDSLQEAETRMRVLLENASDAIISLDEAGCVLRWNAAAEEMFGMPAGLALGMNVNVLAADRCAELAAVFTGMRGADTVSGACDLTFVDGEPRAVEYMVACNHFGKARETTAFIHDITEHKRLTQSIRDMAMTDGLTGIANRRKLLDVLAHALERGRRGDTDMALLFMDLDGFKEINDTYGHDMGDRVLKTFAARLQRCTRASDIVGRLGGDEFVVLAEGMASEAEAVAFAAKIAAAVSVPIADTSISPAPSIGISMYRQQLDVNQWLNEADKAMYQAKRQAGSRTPVAAYGGVERISF